MVEENDMNEGPVISPQGGISREQNKRERIGGGFVGQDVESAGSEQAGENFTPASTVSGGEVLTDTKARLRTLKQDTDDYVRKNPAKAVFVALGIGFVLGLMRRR